MPFRQGAAVGAHFPSAVQYSEALSVATFSIPSKCVRVLRVLSPVFLRFNVLRQGAAVGSHFPSEALSVATFSISSKCVSVMRVLCSCGIGRDRLCAGLRESARDRLCGWARCVPAGCHLRGRGCFSSLLFFNIGPLTAWLSTLGPGAAVGELGCRGLEV